MADYKDITGVSYIGTPANYTAMFITKKVEHLLVNLKKVTHCLVFAEDTIDPPMELRQNHTFVFSKNPQEAYATFVADLSADLQEREQQRKYAYTPEGYFLGENVTIGSNVHIEPGCLLGHDVVIGDNSYLCAGAKIQHAEIGNHFIAGNNCSIGTSSFTFAKDSNGNNIRIPALGNVLIGNNVEIDSQTNVSRGTSGSTVIEDYVKVDSLCHIAHDVHLHKNVEIPAGVILGGYCEIGDSSFIGINAAVRNRVVIGDNVVIGMASAVIRNVDANQTVVGNPANPMKGK